MSRDLCAIDLNADLGEGFGVYSVGDDEAMLDIVSSASVACGAHAGDPEIMAKVFATARTRSVNLGAHPGFPDLWGFGRRVIPCSTSEIEHLVAYQIGAAQALATCAGTRINYVKMHGALANLTETDEDVARAVLSAVRAVDRRLAILAIAFSKLEELGRRSNTRIFTEVFADRAYLPNGGLVPRSHPGAVLHGIEEIVTRTERMVDTATITAIDGSVLAARADSICVHGDTAQALGIASALRQQLILRGITIRAFA